MLQRLYVNNFRCLEDFELNLKDMTSALLIGKNGSGKSTVLKVLEIFQNIGRGISKVSQLINFNDFYHNNLDLPIRFEIEVLLEEKIIKYSLVFIYNEDSSPYSPWNSPIRLLIAEEKLFISGQLLYSVIEGKGNLYLNQNTTSTFLADNENVALTRSFTQASLFKSWLAKMIILAPIPNLITGESNGETLQPKQNASNFGEWISGLLSQYPAAYTQVDKYLKQVMPDVQDFLNEQIGKNAKNMIVRFEAKNTNFSIDFRDLSDGEKCFFICAVVLAANKYYGPLFCFWDEPDNYLSLSEVGHFVTSLRRAFKTSGQILVTSHNEEAIRKFSNENTFILDRKSHLEPTLIRLLSDLPVTGDLINSLISGDI